jgi:hypothetical protein
MIAFGEWAPDLSEAAAAAEAKNVMPAADHYLPLRDVSSKTSALAGACLGAVWYVDENNSPQTFAGTAAKLYKRSSDTWSDFSKVGGYSASSWDFAKWGDWCIATNGVEAPQYVDMSAGTIFADVSGAPIAKCVAVVRDFLVFGDTTESAVSHKNRVRWSAFNNANSYGSSLATQADYQDLLGAGGRVQRIVPGDVGVIFQERSIWTMAYEGGGIIFRFTEVEPGRGTPAPWSVCWRGGTIYYFSHDGFMQFSPGSGSQPIGANKIDQWFKATVDTTRMDEIRGVVDRENRYVYWAFPSTSASTYCDSMLIYHVASGRWSRASVTTEIIFEGVAPEYTLDGLDSILSDIDAESIAVDSRAYLGGATMLSAFDSSHKLATFDGDFLTAELHTPEQSGEARTFITAIRPMVSGSATVTAQIGSRNRQIDNVEWSATGAMNAAGQVTLRRNARHWRVKVSIASGFTKATGIDVLANQEGGR